MHECMAPRKKTKLLRPPTSRIPDHVVHCSILPRLSFKSLLRFSCVSKDWLAAIAAEPEFAVAQSRNPSSVSTAFACLADPGLAFVPSSAPVGVPDPSLSFLRAGILRGARLVAAAGGLLCLRIDLGCRHGRPSMLSSAVLCVMNPATEEAEIVPRSRRVRNVALAFDPAVSLDQYRLIEPYYKIFDDLDGVTTEYRFKVFSSETGRWAKSEQKVRIPDEVEDRMKPVYVGGVVYWNCHESALLWYSVGEDRAGWILLPESDQLHAVGDICAHKGRLTYSRVGEKGVEVWLREDTRWRKAHERSWGEMDGAGADAFTFGYAKLRSGGMAEEVRPLGVGEERLYLGVKPHKNACTERVLYYEATTGKLMYTAQVLKFQQPKNFVLQKVRELDDMVFSYHNSMVPLPQIVRVKKKLDTEEQRG